MYDIESAIRTHNLSESILTLRSGLDVGILKDVLLTYGGETSGPLREAQPLVRSQERTRCCTKGFQLVGPTVCV